MSDTNNIVINIVAHAEEVNFDENVVVSGEKILLGKLKDRIAKVEGTPIQVKFPAGHFTLGETMQLSGLKCDLSLEGHENVDGICDTIIDGLSEYDVDTATHTVQSSDLGQDGTVLSNFVMYDSQYQPFYVQEHCFKMNPEFKTVCRYIGPDDSTYNTKVGPSKTFNSEIDTALVGTRWIAIEITSTTPSNYYNKCDLYFREKNTSSSSIPYSDDDIDKIEVGSYLYLHMCWLCYKFRVDGIVSLDGGGKCFKCTMSDSVDEYGKWLNNYYNTFVKIVNVDAPSRDRLPEFRIVPQAVGDAVAHLNNFSGDKVRMGKVDILFKIVNCKNVSFKNLAIMGNCVGSQKDITKYSNAQAHRVEAEGAIEAKKFDSLTVTNCEFYNLYGFCVRAIGESTQEDGISDVHLVNNYVHDTFGGAFNVEIQHSAIHIEGNLIDGYGRYLPGAGAVTVNYYNSVLVTHNTICNGYYTGITLWGDGIGTGTKTISYNKVFHCLQGLLDDGAGIYCFKLQEEASIHHNLIYDIRTSDRQNVAGLYADNKSSHMNYTYNVIHNCTGGYHNNGGEQNLFKNNLVAYPDYAAFLASTQSGVAPNFKQFDACNNIIVLGHDEGYCPQTYRDSFIQGSVRSRIADVDRSNDSAGKSDLLSSCDWKTYQGSQFCFDNNLVVDLLVESQGQSNNDTTESTPISYMGNTHYVTKDNDTLQFSSVDYSLLDKDIFAKEMDTPMAVSDFTIGVNGQAHFPLDEYIRTIREAGVTLSYLRDRTEATSVLLDDLESLA